MRRSWQTKGRDGAAVQRNISHKHELLAGDIVEVRRRVLELRQKALRFAHDRIEDIRIAARRSIDAELENDRPAPLDR